MVTIILFVATILYPAEGGGLTLSVKPLATTPLAYRDVAGIIVDELAAISFLIPCDWVPSFHIALPWPEMVS